jgi:hypothetical protein
MNFLPPPADSPRPYPVMLFIFCNRLSLVFLANYEG